MFSVLSMEAMAAQAALNSKSTKMNFIVGKQKVAASDPLNRYLRIYQFLLSLRISSILPYHVFASSLDRQHTDA